MKQCLFCHTQLEDDAQFCGTCGRKQEPADVQPAADAITEQETVQAPGDVPFEQSPPAPPAPQAPAPMSMPQADFQQPPAAMPPAGQPVYYQQAPQAAVFSAPAQNIPYPQAPAAGMPQPVQGYPAAQQPPYPTPPPPPKAPSALASDSKHYFQWLKDGLFGSLEPIHLLLAAIVPFLTAFFFTIGRAGSMGWHAGGFFLTWIFNMVLIAGLPVAVWLVKRFLQKEEADLKAICTEYASFHTLILAAAFVVMLLGVLIPGESVFVTVLFSYVRLLSLGAALMCLIGPRDKEAMKKTWILLIVFFGAFVLLTLFADLFFNLGIRWGYASIFRNLW